MKLCAQGCGGVEGGWRMAGSNSQRLLVEARQLSGDQRMVQRWQDCVETPGDMMHVQG